MSLQNYDCFSALEYILEKKQVGFQYYEIL